jgi:hypothetical protein
MIKSMMNTSAGLLLSGALIAAAVVAAYLVGGRSVTDALVGGALVFGFMVLVVAARRRNDAFDVMSGVGDERTRHLYVRSVAFAGTVMSIVLPAWWLVTVAIGEPNTTLSLLCAIFAASWIGGVLVLSRRS